ncbi:Uncharacterised protein [Klebsiella pneumoniae]|uniref:Uncharacterized protein n=1 Tax=Klebsiella pneumoniae TaxID=573 RepID=A0A2X3CMM2_KLEPN|nr:Uncharacterised protein [Klebsiella pneumoniae]
MSVNVKAATLTNLVKYKTDRASLRSVRDDMKKLQKDFSKTEGTIAKAKMQADKQAYTAQMQQQKQVQQQQKQAAKQATVDAKAKQIEARKLAAAQSKAAKIQMQQQQKQASVAENARLKERKALFDIGRMEGLNGAQRFTAARHAQNLVSQYQQGAISLRDMNQQMAIHMTQQKALARNQRKQAKQSGKKSKYGRSGSSGWLSRNVNGNCPTAIIIRSSRCISRTTNVRHFLTGNF